MSNRGKFGLVLAGGGAKGAFQAGALRHLAEIGFEPDVIAGNSIGSLNGALLSNAGNLAEGASKLDEVWTRLGEEDILTADPNLLLQLPKLLKLASKEVVDGIQSFFKDLGLLNRSDHIFDPRPIENLVLEYIDFEKIKNGTEFWATVFPLAEHPEFSLFSFLRNLASIPGGKAKYYRIQDLTSYQDICNIILASAAIPYLFPARDFKSSVLVDGGVADNTPVKALINAGCDLIVVIHLSFGTLWDRRSFPGQTIIEIKPHGPMTSKKLPMIKMMDALLDFSPEKIASLKKRGYQRAREVMTPLLNIGKDLDDLRRVSQQRDQLSQRLKDDPPL